MSLNECNNHTLLELRAMVSIISRYGAFQHGCSLKAKVDRINEGSEETMSFQEKMDLEHYYYDEIDKRDAFVDGRYD